MADRCVIYKNGVKEIAAANDVAVTFMAKYSDDDAGSSCHVHSSLLGRSGEPLFHDPDAGGLGIASLFRGWLGGQVAYTRDLALLYAPYINSYKRYQKGSFAPTRLAVGHENRTCGFRLVGHGPSLRVESRVPGADVNPYLAFAGVLAAGIAGVEEALDFGDVFEGDAYLVGDVDGVPGSLREAIDCFAGSAMARAAFGEEVWEHILHTARAEQAAFDRAVTDWELRRNFERI
jgi:glutamine synthetase